MTAAVNATTRYSLPLIEQMDLLTKKSCQVFSAIFFRRRGVSSYVWESNATAIAFYEELGYRPVRQELSKPVSDKGLG